MWPLLFFKGIFIYESDNIEEEFIMLAFVRCTGSKHCAIRVHLPGYEVKTRQSYCVLNSGRF